MAPSALARCSSASASSIIAASQSAGSCSASGTYSPCASRRARRRASACSISASRPSASGSSGSSSVTSRPRKIASSARSRRATSVPRGIGPAFGEGGVDRVEHRVEPVAAAPRAPGIRNGMPACADLVLGADQPLAHRRRRHEERRGDRRRVEPEHDLQHQRRANAGIDRRMRAGEHQREPAIRNLGVLAGRGLDSSCSASSCSSLGRQLARAPPPRGVDELAPCRPSAATLPD